MTVSILNKDKDYRHNVDNNQGFLTSKNRYVSREEGAEIALDSGQIKEKLIKLYSEDIY